MATDCVEVLDPGVRMTEISSSHCMVNSLDVVGCNEALGLDGLGADSALALYETVRSMGSSFRRQVLRAFALSELSERCLVRIEFFFGGSLLR